MRRTLGDDVREEPAFELRDLFLEKELPLLQALDLDLIVVRDLDQACDHLVEIAVLDFEKFQPVLGLRKIGHRAARPSADI